MRTGDTQVEVHAIVVCNNATSYRDDRTWWKYHYFFISKL